MVVIGAGVLNLILDPLFMFTFGWGMAGAAWATTISQVFGACVFMYIIAKRKEQFGIDEAIDSAHARRMKADGKEEFDPTASFVSRYISLVREIPWGRFLWSCQKLALRAVLILSTYTFASVTATRLGTKIIAAHQVINQLQQLQLNITWAFLSVGQSMTANVYSDPKRGPGPAKLVSHRVVYWGFLVAFVLAGLTWGLRDILPRLFVNDPEVLAIVRSAIIPACCMLAFSWNNALEGCLIGADDANYVVNTYPWAVSIALGVLGSTYWAGMGLPGIWWSLTGYYIALVAWFGARYWGFVGGKKEEAQGQATENSSDGKGDGTPAPAV